MPWADTFLKKLSLRTRAFVLTNEFRLGALEEDDLRRFMLVTSSTPEDLFELKDLVRRAAESFDLTLQQKIELQEMLSRVQAPGGAKPDGHAGRSGEVEVPRRMTRLLRKADSAGGARSASAALRGQTRRILLLDDDPRVRMTFRTALTEAGYVVEESETVDIARRKLGELKFCLVILEIKLRGELGTEILEELIRAGSEVPVVVYSKVPVYRDDFIVSTYPNLRYFVKPSPLDEVLDAVRDLAPVLES